MSMLGLCIRILCNIRCSLFLSDKKIIPSCVIHHKGFIVMRYVDKNVRAVPLGLFSPIRQAYPIVCLS